MVNKVWVVWCIRTNSYYGVEKDSEAIIEGIYSDYDRAQEASKKLGNEAGTIEEFEVK